MSGDGCHECYCAVTLFPPCSGCERCQHGDIPWGEEGECQKACSLCDCIERDRALGLDFAPEALPLVKESDSLMV